MVTETERKLASDYYKRGHSFAFHECIRHITEFATENPGPLDYDRLIDFIIKRHNEYPLIEQIERSALK